MCRVRRVESEVCCRICGKLSYLAFLFWNNFYQRQRYRPNETSHIRTLFQEKKSLDVW